VASENQTGSLHRTGQRDRHREVGRTTEEHEALLDHHIEEVLVVFSDLARMHENAPTHAERSIE
jgi:hypothetical protein